MSDLNQIWNFTYIKSGEERYSRLEAYWEVASDTISDDYTPDEIDAYQLFQKWSEQVQAKYSNNLIPIFWYVDVKKFKPEFMPSQYEHIANY